MLIHGKLILTANGLLLDEVRSLLQKSLRRKEHGFAHRATKELLGFGKDQLPWKSIVTFLFEDHCLNSEEILLRMYQLHKKLDKYACIDLLLEHCGTCRIAACLPVIAIDPEYDPVGWDATLPVDDELRSLVSKQSSRIDFDRLLQHLKNAWMDKNAKKIISYVKMATMVCDHDSCTVTQKGMKYCLFPEKVKPKHVGAVILTLLSKTSKAMNNRSMESYARFCCYFAMIPDVPVRLIVSAVAAQYIHSDSVKTHAGKLPGGKIDWKSVGKLDQIPPWAVDKHTFRGKYGKGTTHILKKPDAKRFTDAELQEFHGPRPKRDIIHFFSEGTLCEQQIMESNPYWERCQELYKVRPKKLQKTIRMTAVYYNEQLKKFPMIKYEKSKNEKDQDGIKITAQKRKVDDDVAGNDAPRGLNGNQRKRAKIEKTGKQLKKPDQIEDEKKPHVSESDTTVTYTITEIEADDDPCTQGPLLQLPTGSAKMYTRVDLTNKVVWKGPYRPDRVQLAMFLHRVLKEVFSDPHTLNIQRKGMYVRFPLLHNKGADMKVTTKDFYDCIGKQQVTGGQFVLRESLGIIQLHNMQPGKFVSLPASFWCHYIFRYLMNVGDSGLYNSITDANMSFLYGIDMEEVRKNVVGTDLMNIMFVKLPKKQVCSEIWPALKRLKGDIMNILKVKYDLNRLVALAKFYQINFGVDQFEARLDKVKRVVERL